MPRYFYEPWGLVYIVPSSLSTRCAPLQSVAVSVKWIDVVARVCLSQKYKNDYQTPVEASYVFPVPARSAVCDFELVRENGTKIAGIIKEKEQAKRDYDEAIVQGKTAALGQEQTQDTFKISVGNINPDEVVTINLTYATELLDDESLDQVKFVLPHTIGCRYGTPPHDPDHSIVASDYSCEISVEIEQTGSIKSISCPSAHGIEFSLGRGPKSQAHPSTPDSHLASVSLVTNSFLQKDFVLTVKSEKLDSPRCVFEPHQSPNHETVAMSLTLVPRFKLNDVKGGAEYIFLVDRSGSMGGSRITMAKKALVVLLRSLPSTGTLFNIFSFGSHCTSLWTSSQAYVQDTMESATNHVDTMRSDYGGTEINSALNHVFSHTSTSHPTNVFVLTDGDAHIDVKATIQNAVATASATRYLRVFCLGIGSSISTDMCETIARTGNGFALFVSDGEQMTGKCAKLVKAARTPPIKDIKVDWCGSPSNDLGHGEKVDDDFEMIEEVAKVTSEKKKINIFDETLGSETTTGNGPPPPMVVSMSDLPEEPIQQAPYVISSLYPGVRFMVYAIISTKLIPKNEPPPKVTLRGMVAGTDDVIELDVPVHLSLEAAAYSPPVHTLAARKLIMDLEDGKHQFPPAIAGNAESLRAHIRTKIISFGLSHNITSSQTSFVAIDDITPIYTDPASTAHGLTLRRPRMELVGGGLPMPGMKCSKRSSHAMSTRSSAASGSWDSMSGQIAYAAAPQQSLHTFARIMPQMRFAAASQTEKTSAMMPPPPSGMPQADAGMGKAHFAAAPPLPPSYPPVMARSMKRKSANPGYERERERVAKKKSEVWFSPDSMDNDEDRLDVLVRLQKINGQFDLTPALLSLLDYGSASDAKASLTWEDEGELNDAVVATLLAIRFMHVTLKDLRDSWEAILEKTMEFLATQLGEASAERAVKRAVGQT